MTVWKHKIDRRGNTTSLIRAFFESEGGSGAFGTAGQGRFAGLDVGVYDADGNLHGPDLGDYVEAAAVPGESAKPDRMTIRVVQDGEDVLTGSFYPIETAPGILDLNVALTAGLPQAATPEQLRALTNAVGSVEAYLPQAQAAAAQALALGTQAVEQSGSLLVPSADLSAVGAPDGRWAYTPDTREMYRREGGQWVKRGDGAVTVQDAAAVAAVAADTALLTPQTTSPHRVNQGRGQIWRDGVAMPPAPSDLYADGLNVVDDGFGNLYHKQTAGQIWAHEYDVYAAMQGTSRPSSEQGKLAQFALETSQAGQRSYLPRLADPRARYQTGQTVTVTSEGAEIDWPGLIEPSGQIAGYVVDLTSGGIEKRPWGPRATVVPGGNPDGTDKTYYRDIWQNTMRIHDLNVKCGYQSLGVALRRWDHVISGRIRVWEANGHGLLVDGMREVYLRGIYLMRCLGHNGRPALDVADIDGGDANNTFYIEGEILSAFECALRVASPHRYKPQSGEGQNPARFLRFNLHVEGNTGADYYDQVRTASATAAAVDIVDAKGVLLEGNYSGGQPTGQQCAIRIGDDDHVPTHIVVAGNVFGNEGDGALVRVNNGEEIDLSRMTHTYLGDRLRSSWWHPRMTGKRGVQGRPMPQLVLASADPRPGTLAGISAELTLDQYLGSVTRREVMGAAIAGQTVQEISARQGGLPTRFNAAGNAIPVTSQVQLYFADGPDLLRSTEQLTQRGWLAGVYGELLRQAGNLGGDGTGYYFTRILADTRAASLLPAASAGNPATWVPELPMSADTLFVLQTSRASLGSSGADVVAALKAVIDAQRPKNWVVLGLYPAASETVGSGSNNAVLTINEALAAWAGRRYVDVYGMLRTVTTAVRDAQGNRLRETDGPYVGRWATSTTQQDMPWEIYYHGNGVNLNERGNRAVAEAVQAKINQLGM